MHLYQHIYITIFYYFWSLLSYNQSKCGSREAPSMFTFVTKFIDWLALILSCLIVFMGKLWLYITFIKDDWIKKQTKHHLYNLSHCSFIIYMHISRTTLFKDMQASSYHHIVSLHIRIHSCAASLHSSKSMSEIWGPSSQLSWIC